MTGGTGLYLFSVSTPSGRTGKFRYTRNGFVDSGVGHGSGYLGRDSDGTLYVPVFGESGGHSLTHEVRIYAQQDPNRPQFRTYRTIAKGLQQPFGVAVGPR